MRTIKPITEAVLAVARSWETVIIQGIAVPVKIAERLTFDLKTGCWRCSGWNSGSGYANIAILGQTIKVHRLMYHLVVGAIPAGHVADHDKDKGCRYRDCIHPHHMTPLTVKHNTHKGSAKLFLTNGALAQMVRASVSKTEDAGSMPARHRQPGDLHVVDASPTSVLVASFLSNPQTNGDQNDFPPFASAQD